ncbi:MAG: C69 family dipeptidase [Candidatus Marinimicrobia bacterium]|nr:C69 family dipeptidase [Candidatus Neomarinimicrobiota bacterium]MBL7010359.1 C69 family dipeptidase [Candidatus Neomarinimicrobiota bacterium]MBL7030750.1 C69 family dipeptidase [Candidatus Neomarinimicrobiota bacterium]
MCDTFVALNKGTGDGSVIFGKNSDREPNEAQSLEYHPLENHSPGDTVNCTYLTIPQVDETNGILISRPFWMWGAEMGINTQGVAIGNEAVFTKMPYNKGNTLTGMDLLRLALERAPTAIRALETITGLLAEFGQGGICGYTDKKFTYHNSFIIADKNEAWILETVGHLWAAVKVKDYYAISNGLTIGTEFDLSHPDLISFAQTKGWLKKGHDFLFADCYSDWFYTKFSKCKARRNRANHINSEMNVAKAFAHLRDHGGEENYSPHNHFFMNHICAHSANPIARDASQSVGSMVAHLQIDSATAWTTGTSAPCTGLFKPIDAVDVQLPEDKTPGATYDSNSLWWRHEKLHRTILQNYPRKISIIKNEQSEFEKSSVGKFQSAHKDEKKTITLDAFKKADELTKKWLDEMQSSNSRIGKWNYKRYWNKQNKNAGIEY